MNKSITIIALFLTLTGLLLLQGCSSGNALGTVNVTGTVTVDGTAMEEISITFIPRDSEGREAYGFTDAQGKFVLTIPGAEPGSGAIPGQYIVTFSKDDDPLSRMTEEEIERLTNRPNTVNLLPARYLDRTAPDIASVTVERGKQNTFAFELSSQ